jgi:hypothetical protein
MRLLSASLFGLAMTASAASAAEPAAVVQQSWETTFASEVRYYAWTSNRGSPTTVGTAPGKGSEIYVPFAAQLAGKLNENLKVQFLARGGWVHAHQSTAGLSGTVDTVTDTVMTGTFTYLGINGFQPFVSVSVNAPTGKSALFGTAANARMDPDLVEIASFGEGWNVGPTAGANLSLTPTMIVTTSVGYTWRGSFDRERSTSEPDPTVQSPTGVNPGDVLTATAAIGSQEGTWAWNVSGTVSEETTTTENSVELYRAGRRYVGAATVSHTWPERWGQTTLNGSYAHSNRNKVLFLGAPPLIKEIMNTNSDVYRVGLQHLFLVGDNLAVGPTASYLHRDENGYDPGTLQFVPAKDRWAAGGIARMAAGPKVTLNARGEYVWTHENERIAPGDMLFSVLANAFVPGSAVPVVSSNGWMASGGANVKF